MKIKREMKIKAVLELDEKLLDVFLWLAPEFDRLRNPRLHRATSDFGKGKSKKAKVKKQNS